MKLMETVKAGLRHIKTSDVAEVAIATWCIEYLQIRKYRVFNLPETIAISLLMLMAKAVITEAARRRTSENHQHRNTRTVVMSSRRSQVGEWHPASTESRSNAWRRPYQRGFDFD